SAQSRDEWADDVLAKLVGCTVREEDGRDLDDLLLHLEAVLGERRAGLDEIDDEIGEAGDGRELDGALHVDDLDLHALADEVGLGGARILRGDARHAEGGVLRAAWSDLAGDDEAAAADAEIEGL